MPLLRCPISDYYCRQEKQGLLVGFYEQDCRTWGLDGIDPNFTNASVPQRSWTGSLMCWRARSPACPR